MVDKTASEVLLFTQDMMLAVMEERWDDLIEMQSVQDGMLKDLFAATQEFSEQQKEQLFEVQRLNQEIISEADKHKADIANTLRKMSQGKAKINAYQSV